MMRFPQVATLPRPLQRSLTTRTNIPSPYTSGNLVLTASSSPSRTCLFTNPPQRNQSTSTSPEPARLPDIGRPRGVYVVLGVLAVTTCVGFFLYSINDEKAHNAAVRAIMYNLKRSFILHEHFGKDVEPVTGFRGNPWISGEVNTMKGKVDISFKIKGSKDSGTVYVTSIRRSKHDRYFELIRCKVITDSGKTIDLTTTTDQNFAASFDVNDDNNHPYDNNNDDLVDFPQLSTTSDARLLKSSQASSQASDNKLV